jgi:hypothetical protein
LQDSLSIDAILGVRFLCNLIGSHDIFSYHKSDIFLEIHLDRIIIL